MFFWYRVNSRSVGVGADRGAVWTIFCLLAWCCTNHPRHPHETMPLPCEVAPFRSRSPRDLDGGRMKSWHQHAEQTMVYKNSCVATKRSISATPDRLVCFHPIFVRSVFKNQIYQNCMMVPSCWKSMFTECQNQSRTWSFVCFRLCFREWFHPTQDVHVCWSKF